MQRLQKPDQEKTCVVSGNSKSERSEEQRFSAKMHSTYQHEQGHSYCKDCREHRDDSSDHGSSTSSLANDAEVAEVLGDVQGPPCRRQYVMASKIHAGFLDFAFRLHRFPLQQCLGSHTPIAAALTEKPNPEEGSACCGRNFRASRKKQSKSQVTPDRVGVWGCWKRSGYRATSSKTSERWFQRGWAGLRAPEGGSRVSRR